MNGSTVMTPGSEKAAGRQEQRGTWVAFGEVGAVGSVRRSPGGFEVRLLSEDGVRGVYDSLDAAKGALRALVPGQAESLEFREH